VTAQLNSRVIIIIEVLTANFLCFWMVEQAMSIEQHILPFIDESTSRYAYIIKKTIVNFNVKINQTRIENVGKSLEMCFSRRKFAYLLNLAHLASPHIVRF